MGSKDSLEMISGVMNSTNKITLSQMIGYLLNIETITLMSYF